MKSLYGLTLRYMVKNRKRTKTTIVGVLMSTILIFLLFELTYSVKHSSQEYSYRQSGGWDIAFTMDSTSAKEFREAAASTIAGASFTNYWIRDNSVSVIAIDDFSRLAVPLEVEQGTMPKKDYEALVDIESGYKIGEMIGDDEYLVVGILKENEFTSGEKKDFPLMNPVVLLSDEKLQLLPEATVYLTCSVKDDLQGQAGRIRSEMADKLGTEIYDRVNPEALTLYGQDTSGSADVGSEAILLIAAVIIAAFLMVIIRNAFNISVDERLKDYGILRCIGITQSQIIKMILTEAVIVALIGAALGMLIGYGASALMLRSSAGASIGSKIFGAGFTAHEIFSLKAILITLGMVLLTTSVSMVAPIEKLFRMSPIEAQCKLEKTSRPRKRKSLLDKAGKTRIEVSYGILSAKRNRGRFIRTVISFALGLALVISFGTLLRTAIRTEVPYLHEYNYAAQTGELGTWKKMTAAMKSSVNTSEMEYQLSYWDRFEKEDKGGAKTLEYGHFVTGLSDGLWELIKKDASITGAADSGQTEVILVNAVFGSDPEYKTGDSFKLDYSDKEFRVIGTVSEAAAELSIASNACLMMKGTKGTYIYHIDPDNLPFEEFTPEKITRFELDAAGFDSGVMIEAVSGKAEELRKELLTYSTDVHEVDNVFRSTKMVEYLVYGILAFLMLISVVNQINVERGILNARQDELKILSDIGMTAEQKNRMLLVENLTASVAAAIVGTVIGIAAGALMVYIIYSGNGFFGKFSPGAMEVRFGINWVATLIAIALVILSGWLVALFSRKED